MKGVGLRLASYEFLEFIKIIKSSWGPVGRWNSSRRQGGSRTEKGQGGEGAGRDKRFGVRSRLRVDKRGKERESEWKWKEYAVTGSLWLRCLVYHNTRPSVRGTRTGGCTEDPPRNGSNVSEDRENPVVDGRGSRPLKGLRCERT